ncbi:hypothetical protein HKD37_02G004698 [Glycine soja]
MIGCTSSKFSDIVVIVERVERDMRKWRIDSPRATNSKTLPSGTRKKKRREHQCNDGTKLKNFSYYHHPTNPSSIQFDPIPISDTELLPLLLQNSLVILIWVQPQESPYPRGYDAKAKCDYLAGVIGHSSKNCTALKFKIAGWLNFKEDNPNIGNNPLPGHREPSVSIIEEGGELLRRMRVEDEMCKFGMIEDTLNKDEGYNLHLKASQDFKQILQDLMDRKLVLIGYFKSDVSPVDSSSNFPKPFVVHHTKCSTSSVSSGLKLITIQVGKDFPYKDNKVVPWRYEVKNANSEATNVTNIVGISTTESIVLVNQELNHLKKKRGKEVVRSPEEQTKEISNEEAYEFLKLVKQGEYTMMDQLNCTLAKISLLSLMLNSEPCRKVLLKILNEAHAIHEISEDKFKGIAGNVIASNYLTFTNEEIPEDMGKVLNNHLIWWKIKTNLVWATNHQKLIKGGEPRIEGVPIYDLLESFWSAGFEFLDSITAVEEDIFE